MPKTGYTLYDIVNEALVEDYHPELPVSVLSQISFAGKMHRIKKIDYVSNSIQLNYFHPKAYTVGKVSIMYYSVPKVDDIIQEGNSRIIEVNHETKVITVKVIPPPK